MKIISACLVACMFVFGISACDDAGTKIETAGDTGFARRTFESLARGDITVADDLDWHTLVALGQNVGALYTTQETASEKQRFVEGFITQFAAAFRETGGNVENITNWRVESHDSQHTRVMADAPNGSLRITVSERDGRERVSSIGIAP